MDGRFRGPPSPRPRFSGRSVSTNPTVAVSLSSRLTACSSGVQTRQPAVSARAVDSVSKRSIDRDGTDRCSAWTGGRCRSPPPCTFCALYLCMGTRPCLAPASMARALAFKSRALAFDRSEPRTDIQEAVNVRLPMKHVHARSARSARLQGAWKRTLTAKHFCTYADRSATRANASAHPGCSNCMQGACGPGGVAEPSACR